MNRLAQITALSASIDTTLTQFAGLMPNEAGEMPWQAAQRQKRNRRVAAGAVGAAAIGAGVYGANKLKGAMNTRYGTSGMDGIKTGAADLVNRADDAVKAGVSRVKTAAAPMIDKVKSMAAPVMDPLKRKVAAGKLSYGRGVAQKQGLGKLVGRVARAVVHASRADELTEFTGDFTVRNDGVWATGRNLGTGMHGSAMMPPEMRAGLDVRRRYLAVKKKFKPLGMAASKVIGSRSGRLAKFSRAAHIIALERKLDGALAEFKQTAN